jgi:hypothetical protein
MRQLLHIITRPDNQLVHEIVATQKSLPEHQVEIVNLFADTADYDDLLEKIFTAESIQIW